MVRHVQSCRCNHSMLTREETRNTTSNDGKGGDKCQKEETWEIISTFYHSGLNCCTGGSFPHVLNETSRSLPPSQIQTNWETEEKPPMVTLHLHTWHSVRETDIMFFIRGQEKQICNASKSTGHKKLHYSLQETKLLMFKEEHVQYKGVERVCCSVFTLRPGWGS